MLFLTSGVDTVTSATTRGTAATEHYNKQHLVLIPKSTTVKPRQVAYPQRGQAFRIMTIDMKRNRAVEEWGGGDTTHKTSKKQ